MKTTKLEAVMWEYVVLQHEDMKFNVLIESDKLFNLSLFNFNSISDLGDLGINEWSSSQRELITF